MGLIPIIAYSASIWFTVQFIKHRTALSNFCSEVHKFTTTFLPRESSIHIGLRAKAGAMKKLKIAYGLCLLLTLVSGITAYISVYLKTSNKLMGGILVAFVPLGTFFIFFSTVHASFLFIFTFFMEYMSGLFGEYAKVFKEEEKIVQEGSDVDVQKTDEKTPQVQFLKSNVVKPETIKLHDNIKVDKFNSTLCFSNKP